MTGLSPSRWQTSRVMTRTLMAVVFSIAVGNSVSLARTWTDRRGRTLEAEFVSFDNGLVTIRRDSDNKLFEVPLATLSDADQDFVRAHAGRSAGTARPADSESAHDAGDRLATKAVTEFFEALRASDLDTLVRVTAVPFLDESNHFVKDAQQLKTRLQQFAEEDLDELTYKITRTFRFKELSSQLEGRSGDSIKQLNLQDEDRVVLAESVARPGKHTDKFLLMVRIGKDRGVIAALRDVP